MSGLLIEDCEFLLKLFLLLLLVELHDFLVFESAKVVHERLEFLVLDFPLSPELSVVHEGDDQKDRNGEDVEVEEVPHWPRSELHVAGLLHELPAQFSPEELASSEKEEADDRSLYEDLLQDVRLFFLQEKVLLFRRVVNFAHIISNKFGRKKAFNNAGFAGSFAAGSGFPGTLPRFDQFQDHQTWGARPRH